MSTAPHREAIDWRRWAPWFPAALLILLAGVLVVARVPAAAVNVRWVSDLPVAERARLERTFMLSRPDRRTEDTWAYTLLDVSRGNVRRLVEHGRVDDTHGVDRNTFTVNTASDVMTVRGRWLAWADARGLLGGAAGLLALLTVWQVARMALRTPPGTARGRWSRRALAALLFAVFVTAAYLTSSRTLTADDSFSVWIAQAVLRGDRVYQDVFDAGAPLLWWLSLAGQWVSGGRVIGEVGLAVLLGAAGCVVSTVLAWQASRSVALAAWSGALAGAAFCASQLYSYPKVALYPVALAVLWWFAGRPTRIRAVALGLTVAIAVLTRHDHGLYVGLAAASAVVLADGPTPFWQRLATVAVAGLVPLLPWLVVVASREGIVSYLSSRMQVAQSLGIEDARSWPALRLAWPLIGADEAWPVRVQVQWQAGLAADARATAEQALRLRPVGASTERYTLHDTSTRAVEALARHQNVVAVGGVDTLAGRPSGLVGSVTALRNWLAARSLAPLPRVLGRREASVLLYSILILLPLAVLVLAVPALRNVPGPMGQARYMIPAVVLLAGAHFGLVRRPVQILETLPLDLVLLAGVARQCWGAAVHRLARPVLRVAVALVVAMVALLGADAVHAGDLLTGSEVLNGGAAIRSRAARLWTAHVAAPPLDVFAPEGAENDRTFVRYLQACTRPADRIWEPTGNFATPYYADRGVVQHLFWYTGFRSSDAEQRQTLRWLETQRVPLVLIRQVGSARDVFAGHPLIRDYIRDRYVDVTSPRARSDVFTEGRPLTILSRRDLVPTGRYEMLDLPCFAG